MPSSLRARFSGRQITSTGVVRKSFCRPLKRARDTGDAWIPTAEAVGYGSYGGFAAGGTDTLVCAVEIGRLFLRYAAKYAEERHQSRRVPTRCYLGNRSVAR